MADKVRSGAEIKVALEAFVARWRDYSGSERAEAQTFLNELFRCYGTDRVGAGARFEHFQASAGFMDLFQPGQLIIEMKAPHQPLTKATDQRERYWRESSDPATDTPAARYVIACNFMSFEIWEPGRFPNAPRATIALADLPERYDALLFLQAPNLEPVFVEHRRELTAEAAKHVAQLYQSLADRSAAPIDEIQRFTMQAVWCLFAEDLGMLEGFPLQATVNQLLSEAEPDSARDIGYLFTLLNQKGNHNRRGRYAGTRYVNGELFAKPAAVMLTKTELQHLRAAAEFDWRAVDPTIFGSLMEGVLGQQRRWELGAHYTHEADILKIVTPTIVRPWRDRIEATTTPAEARALLDELCSFRVLDPACGCGNFLYVAYRELRSLESDLKRRIRTLAAEKGLPVPAGPWPYFPLTNLYGLDIERVAVLIARVTLWMGHRQMIELHGEAEDPLPLVDLTGITVADALRTPWPEADAIVGNPPFLGDRKIRAAFGGGYVDWLKKEFRVGVVDFSAYWFRRAAQHLRPGQRAGFVSTNTLRENKHRKASLDYVVEQGGVITDAVSSQRWPGDAKVHVSLTNWVQEPEPAPEEFVLDGRQVLGITTQLREGTDSWEPQVLPQNRRRSFIGCQPTGDGFLMEPDEAFTLLERGADRRYLRPYLTGEDITTDPEQEPRRWAVDFGTEPLESAARHADLLDILRRRVKPEREASPNLDLRKQWWQFWRPRPEMRKALRPLDRFIASTATGKRLLLSWQASEVCSSNLTVVYAFDDDYSMGILLSRAHTAWAWARASTLETRLRYTPSSVFETFPWPEPTDAQRVHVSAAAVALYEHRSALCQQHGIGLTKLYNLMDDGAFTELVALHRELDEAVADAYGWPAAVAQDDAALVRLLTTRNQEIAEGTRPYAPFG